MAKSEKLPPIHPGEILREDFMKPLGLSMKRLALDLRVPVTRITEIVHERRGITPDTALRLGRYFNTSARFWMNAQSSYDLEVAQDELKRTIERDVRPLVHEARSLVSEGTYTVPCIPKMWIASLRSDQDNGLWRSSAKSCGLGYTIVWYSLRSGSEHQVPLYN